MCGIGVTSLIMLTSSPAACNARIAASRPEPGPFTKTSTDFMPCSIATFAAVSAAVCAAKGVALSGASKTQLTGACPRNGVALGVGDGDNCVVKSGLNMRGTAVNILALTASGEWRFSCALLSCHRNPPLLISSCWLSFSWVPLRVLALVLERCPLTAGPYGDGRRDSNRFQ